MDETTKRRQTDTKKIKSFKLSLKIAETTLQPFHMQNLQIEINQLEMTLTYHTWIIIPKLDLLALASKINWICYYFGSSIYIWIQSIFSGGWTKVYVICNLVQSSKNYWQCSKKKSNPSFAPLFFSLTLHELIRSCHIFWYSS